MHRYQMFEMKGDTKILEILIASHDHSTKARPTLSLLWWASSKAWRSRRRRSSNLNVVCRRWAAARAPGPRWASLSKRHIAWALTTVTLVALLVSPITLPRRPSASPSQPLALAIAAHLAWAKHLNVLWRSEDRSPKGPATSLPSSRQRFFVFNIARIAEKSNV